MANKSLTITTWNINSVRLRIALLGKLAEEKLPDVICLQEIKCEDHVFPAVDVAALGYKYQHVHGMKSYNGVAILSKLPLDDLQVHDRVSKNDRRHISARIAGSGDMGGLEIHNLYVPAGGDIPDVDQNEKFRHKLNFVDEMALWSGKINRKDPRILVGDFNIAPEEHDVWSHKQLLNVVSHTPVEVEKLRNWLGEGEWVDTARHFTPLDQKLYSWWSYRNSDWRKSNRGRRLDHMWVSPELKSTLQSIEHDAEARDWQPAPSDHVPVTLKLKF